MSTSPIDACVGEMVRRHRKAIGLTQAQLAARMGVGRVTVTNIEAGRGPLSVAHLQAICPGEMDAVAVVAGAWKLLAEGWTSARRRSAAVARAHALLLERAPDLLAEGSAP